MIRQLALLIITLLVAAETQAANACFDLFTKSSSLPRMSGVDVSKPIKWTSAEEKELIDLRGIGNDRTKPQDLRLVQLKKKKSKYLIETVFSGATEVTGTMAFQRPYNKGLLKHLERRTILKPSLIKTKTSTLPELEGLIPVDARWLGRELTENQKREHNLEVVDLVKGGDFVRSEVMKGDVWLVEREGKLQWVADNRPNDLVVEVLANHRGYFVTGDVDILMFARKDWNPNSPTRIDSKWGHVQEGDIAFLEMLSKIWHRVDPRQPDREIPTHCPQNLYSEPGKIQYPVVAYHPDGLIYTINKGPGNTPHSHLIKFLDEARKAGWNFQVPEAWGLR